MEFAYDLLSNPDWRVEHLYKIVNKDGQKIQFKRNQIQRKINAINRNRKMVLKARQFGISTDGIITKFDRTVFTPNTTTAIIAHEKDAIEKLFRIVIHAHKTMPDELRPILDRGGGSKHELFFPEINSRIYCDLEIRGGTIQNLHVSEAAFMKDSSKLKATLQAVPKSGFVDIETTANGMANYFYEMWNDPDQPYAKIFIPWYEFDEYRLDFEHPIKWTDDELRLKDKALKFYSIKIDDKQIAYRRFKKAELKESSYDKTKVTFEQEYPEDDQTCFLSSGEAVMDLFVLKELIDKAKDPIEDNGWKQIYQKYDKKMFYVCGADTAEGKRQGDYSVGVVIGVSGKTRNVVAKIRGHWKPIEFAHRLKDLCSEYAKAGRSWPLLGVERNNHGHAVLLELEHHIGYPNLFHRVVDSDGSRDESPGWVTDQVTRPIMINTFINVVENKSVIVDDKSILSECLTLINSNGKIEAADSKHDDCVVATAIGIQLLSEASVSEIYENIETKILV